MTERSLSFSSEKVLMNNTISSYNKLEYRGEEIDQGWMINVPLWAISAI